MGNLLKTIGTIIHYRVKVFKKPELSTYEYPQDYEVLKIKHQGNIKWKNANIYICECLAGENIGIKKRNEKYYDVYYGSFLIRTLDRFRLCTI